MPIYYTAEEITVSYLQGDTVEEKHNKVRTALLDPAIQGKSDRAIAELCGVSAPTVGKMRRHLIKDGIVSAYSFKRVDKRGRTIKIDNIGTKGRSAEENILEIAESLLQQEIQQIMEAIKKLL